MEMCALRTHPGVALFFLLEFSPSEIRALEPFLYFIFLVYTPIKYTPYLRVYFVVSSKVVADCFVFRSFLRAFNALYIASLFTLRGNSLGLTRDDVCVVYFGGGISPNS